MSPVTAKLANHTLEGDFGLDVLLCNSVHSPTPHSASFAVLKHTHDLIGWSVKS